MQRLLLVTISPLSRQVNATKKLGLPASFRATEGACPELSRRKSRNLTLSVLETLRLRCAPLRVTDAL
jgi:hypothetical protein